MLSSKSWIFILKNQGSKARYCLFGVSNQVVLIAATVRQVKLGSPKGGDVTSGFHCWAEFYLPGTGWVMVDPAAQASGKMLDYFDGKSFTYQVTFKMD
nr:transglutaminase family protein [uncultured Desulfobacter sp.]